jgi:IS1 family transposase
MEDNTPCWYCGESLAKHADEETELNNNVCYGSKGRFTCRQSRIRLCECEPDEAEPDRWDDYKSTQETRHVGECKYSGCTTICTSNDSWCVTIIKNNITKKETEICAYGVCCCLEKSKN